VLDEEVELPSQLGDIEGDATPNGKYGICANLPKPVRAGSHILIRRIRLQIAEHIVRDAISIKARPDLRHKIGRQEIRIDYD